MQACDLVLFSSWIIFVFTVVGVLIVFDPLGSLRRPALSLEGSRMRNLESSESSQLFYTARSVATRVWESRLRLLCCCLPQDDNHRAAFSSISQLFSGFFSVSFLLTDTWLDAILLCSLVCFVPTF